MQAVLWTLSFDVQRSWTVISSLHGIYADDIAIHSRINSKYERFVKIKLAFDLENFIQSVANWAKKCLANFNESKMQLSSLIREAFFAIHQIG